MISTSLDPSRPTTRTSTVAEEADSDPKNLPLLDDLVKRLSPEVRETLDDLFRAKFTAVRRVSARLLKT